MAKSDVAKTSQKIYDLLAAHSTEERARAVQAALILCGDAPAGTFFGPSDPPAPNPPATQSVNSESLKSAQAFFTRKDPQNKGELLATAARFRELTENKESHSKEELRKVILDARRHFDSKHFARDMRNARVQSGLFNVGKSKDANVLSYYGQQFVDALPNRVDAEQLAKPKDRRAQKKGKKKAK